MWRKAIRGSGTKGSGNRGRGAQAPPQSSRWQWLHQHEREAQLGSDWPGGPILRSLAAARAEPTRSPLGHKLTNSQPLRAQTHPQPSRAQTHASQALAFSPGLPIRQAPQRPREGAEAAMSPAEAGGTQGLSAQASAASLEICQGGPAFGARTKLVTRKTEGGSVSSPGQSAAPADDPKL